ncbi:hypothetical protein CHUAL_005630 [Chamberlinius hualienensis]
MTESNCIFCKIASGLDPKTKLLYQDENFVVFNDIRPSTKHHYLVVPKVHIPNINSLKEDQDELVEDLVQIGTKVLQEQGGDLDDVSLGFHRPPFTSISHLHLHVMSPTSSMGFISRLIFKPDSYWFTTVKTLRIALRKGKL